MYRQVSRRTRGQAKRKTARRISHHPLVEFAYPKIRNIVVFRAGGEEAAGTVNDDPII
jgi:hypothetical protein